MSTKSKPKKTEDERESFKSFETTTGIKFVSAGLAASFAELVTLPIDTSKVRLQVRLCTLLGRLFRQKITRKTKCMPRVV